MMNTETIIDALADLGQNIAQTDFESDERVRKAVAANPWFTVETVQMAVQNICMHYLDKQKMTEWMHSYQFKPQNERVVGLIMAGNIPLVGFHDLMSVLLSGHKALVKLSERDTVLMQWLVEELIERDDRFTHKITITERLNGMQAVIATGSDSTAAYFHKYFSSYPHIIRKNRSAIGIVRINDTQEQLRNLGHDIFNYFGLGCRNVSKLYLEKGVELSSIFEAIQPFESVIYHHKYKNNYDYNNAMYLLNRDEFYTNGFLILKPSKEISSRIACMHYEYYDDSDSLISDIKSSMDQIQCIMTSEPWPFDNSFVFGQGQSPSLNNYADGVDTMQFLTQLT